MALRRQRTRPFVRASLVATVVAFMAVLSMLASSIRASDALLGVTLARARAAATSTPQHRVERLSVDDDADRSNDLDTLTTPTEIEIIKASGHPRPSDKSAGARVATLAPALTVLPLRVDPLDTGLRSPPVEPPTRGRARLMVFLN